MKGGDMEHTMEELATLLQYLVKHNEDHAAELLELAGRARELGKQDAYDHLATGVELLKGSNTTIQIVPPTTKVVRKGGAHTRGFFASVEEMHRSRAMSDSSGLFTESQVRAAASVHSLRPAKAGAQKSERPGGVSPAGLPIKKSL